MQCHSALCGEQHSALGTFKPIAELKPPLSPCWHTQQCASEPRILSLQAPGTQTLSVGLIELITLTEQ